jgi:hypothetical protein
VLPIIAKRILSLTCSTSSCKRNCSMYFFVHSETRNHLEVEKAKALVYIYTNSHFLRQRPDVDPICYYDDNIFSEDFDDDGRALSKTDDDDNDDNNGNNGNGSKGHDGNDGDAFDRREEHHRESLSINSGNVQEECPYDWNEINEEVENGVDKQAAMGSIRNVHVNEDAPIGSTQLGYDQADEGADDDNKNEVANEHGKENGNVHGHNGDRNNYGEGGPSGTAVCCNLHWQWRWWT